MKKLLAFVLLFFLLSGCLQEQSEEKIEAALLQEDVEFLVRSIEEIHPDPYTKISKEEFYMAKDEVLREIRDMDKYEFYKLIAPLVALIGDGHTAVYSPEMPEKCFPVPVAILQDRIFVARDHENFTAGSEILSIEGIEAKKLIEDMLRYVPYERYESGLASIERDFPLLLYLVTGDISNFKVVFQSENRTEEVSVKASTAPPHIYPYRYGYDFFQKFVNVSLEALYPYAFYPLDNKTALLIINSFRQSEYIPFDSFLTGVFYYLKDHNIENLIIDIRANPGGDSSLGDMLIDYLTDEPWTQFGGSRRKVEGSIRSSEGDLEYPSDNPLRFSGYVYLLTSSTTSSSGRSFAAAIKDFGIGTIIGEETGGIFPSFGGAFPFELPNSKMMVGCSTTEWYRWKNIDPGRGVIPDYEIKPMPEDLVNGRDRALEFTLGLIDAA